MMPIHTLHEEYRMNDFCSRYVSMSEQAVFFFFFLHDAYAVASPRDVN